eukprot:TRINITY_DN21111_c0_g2_i1.p1 TRINITY_DN21111_c0_g2~~TRINITY_DN21111_c0_g2_i1.p1  ORF type:complete len:388 (+),score=53.52 TRINITY_DN21111_c0_g2_i1:94-1257(+)
MAAAAVPVVEVRFEPSNDGEAILPVYVLARASTERFEVRRAPVFDAAGPIRSCSASSRHCVLIPELGGPLQCIGENDCGQLGVGDIAPRQDLCATVPPLSATAVEVSERATFAICGNGKVFSCGAEDVIGRGGDPVVPAAVRRLPPVALLATVPGRGTLIAISVEDEAYVWGRGLDEFVWWSGGYDEPRPVYLAALSGLGICRLACGARTVAETKHDELLVWGEAAYSGGRRPVRRRPREMRFPLRGFACPALRAYAADGAGTVWEIGSECNLINTRMPQRALQLAVRSFDLVALSEEGELWVSPYCCGWRRIRAPHSERPLGLVPHGGQAAEQVVLTPDYCGGKWRVKLFVRIAMRIGVPCDPLRVMLVPFRVHKMYFTGSSTDPF